MTEENQSDYIFHANLPVIILLVCMEIYMRLSKGACLHASVHLSVSCHACMCVIITTLTMASLSLDRPSIPA